MDLPNFSGFDRIVRLAGQIRAAGKDRERLAGRLQKLIEAMIFLERLRGQRGPPLSEADFQG